MKLLLIGMLCPACFAAFNSATNWDVRTTGSDSNGGGFYAGSGGTNYAMQDLPQVAYTDIVIGATTTQATSLAHPFTSAYVGNIVNVTSGSGCTAQRAQITSVSSGTATFDKALGTAASICTGNLGGALLTLGTANTSIVSGNTINIKTGTYTLTSSLLVSQATSTFYGYGTTWGDNSSSKPTITTATNSVDLITTNSNGGIQVWNNIKFTNTAATPGYGISQVSAHGTTQYWIINSCNFIGFVGGINSGNLGSYYDVANLIVLNTEVQSTSIGIWEDTGNTIIEGCYVHGTNSTSGIDVQGSFAVVTNTIVSGASGNGLNGHAGLPMIVSNSDFVNITGAGISPGLSSSIVSVHNSIFYNNANGSIAPASGLAVLNAAMSRSNAFGSNGASNWLSSTGDVALTANPFTNSAGGDFSLNSATGGGALLKSAGYPGPTFPGGTTSSNLNIGAYQASGSSASVIPAPIIIH